MLYLVEVRNNHGDLLSLPLEDTSGGFSVKDIGGLDPVKATLTSSKFAQIDGEEFESSTRETRNITMKLGIETDYVTATVKSLRQRLYAFFMPDTPVELRFYDNDDDSVVYINGHVETCEAPLFTDEPEADISIMCFEPDFVDENALTVNGSTTPNTTGSGDTLINYTGSIKTGFIFALNVNRSITEFTLYHQPPDDTLRQLDFAAPLSVGDTLTLNTVVGSKGATLTRAGSDSSYLYGVSPQSTWLTLLPGVNSIRAYALGSPIPFTLQYTPLYGGL